MIRMVSTVSHLSGLVRFASLVVLLLAPVAAGRRAYCDEVETMVKVYERSKSGSEQLAEGRELLKRITERYSAQDAPMSFRDDRDLERLGALRLPGVLLACQQIIVEERPRVRRVLVHVIERSGWRGAAGSLGQVLAKSKDPEERVELCRAISTVRNPASLEILRRHLVERGETETDAVIAACCRGIAAIAGRRDETTRQKYRAIVESHGGKVRDSLAHLEVALACFRLGDSRKTGEVLAALERDATPRPMRIGIARMFEESFCEPAIAVLARLAAGRDEELADAALASLAGMTGFEQPADLPPPSEAVVQKPGEGPENENALTARRRLVGQIMEFWELNAEKIREEARKPRTRIWSEKRPEPSPDSPGPSNAPAVDVPEATPKGP